MPEIIKKFIIFGVWWLASTVFTNANPILKTIQAGGFEREYLIYTPQHPQREKADGLIVCLHGFERTMNDFIDDYQISKIADSLNLIVAAPQALPEQNPLVYLQAAIINSFTDSRISLNSVWGCGLSVKVFFKPLWMNLLNEELNRDVDDVGFINQMIDNILFDYSLPTENLFMLGTSMGGYMAYQFALKKGERLSGLVSIAGSMGLAIKGMDYLEEIARFIRTHLSEPNNNIPDITAQKPFFYPNPVQDIVYFNMMDGIVSVFDIAGKKVYSESLSSGQANLSFLKQGVYIIRMQSGGMVQVNQLIKR